MQHLIDIFCVILFFVLVAVPSLIGFHMYLLMFLAGRRRKQALATQRQVVAAYTQNTPDGRWPRVTTQLPLYNELAVARRIIEAAARMDYPAGRHEVQVLDDSTDETRDLVDQVAAELCAQGYDVKVIRRPTRQHYKAGALHYGLARATGEFVAVFDADFVPDRGFLRRLIPLVATRDDICCVQGRWGHLNADETWITQGLALGLDMHFAVEQAARGWNGLLMSFNGTGGIWRKAAVDDPRVGGWSGDTITEDLDLSYRAQLAGWKMVYCIGEECPAELPSDVNALKTQQHRWAVGTMQTARKILPTVWRSHLPLMSKLEATVHLTQYAVAIPMILVALFGRLLPLLLAGEAWPQWIQWLGVMFLGATIAPWAAYINASYVLGKGIPGPARIFKLTILGLGLCVNNGVAVLTGLFKDGGEFVRTPKSGNVGTRPRQTAYAALRTRLWVFELLLGLACLTQWAIFLRQDGIGGLFMLLYAIGLIRFGWGSRPKRAPREQVIRVRTVPAAVPTLPSDSGAPACEPVPTPSVQS